MAEAGLKHASVSGEHGAEGILNWVQDAVAEFDVLDISRVCPVTGCSSDMQIRSECYLTYQFPLRQEYLLAKRALQLHTCSIEDHVLSDHVPHIRDLSFLHPQIFVVRGSVLPSLGDHVSVSVLLVLKMQEEILVSIARGLEAEPPESDVRIPELDDAISSKVVDRLL